MFSILLAPLSPFGLILGAAAFLAALAPSMIPRPAVLQGVEAGIAFALLYGVGTGARALWSWLELPVAGDCYPRAFLRMSILLCLALVGYGLLRETDWQNAIRRAMGMPAVPAGLPVLIAIVSAPVAVFLIGLARLFNASAMLISARLAKFVPRRIAIAIGFGIAAVLFWTIGNGLLLRTALHQLDSSYRRIDVLLPAETSPCRPPSAIATACFFLATSKATKTSLCFPMVRPPCMRLGSANPSNPRPYLHERAGHRREPANMTSSLGAGPFPSSSFIA